MNRTTILLDEELQKRLKAKAKKEGKTVTRLIETYIRAGLNKSGGLSKPPAKLLPSFSLGEAYVDPSDRSRLWDLMDEK